jgi:hypothetical protein
MSLHLAEIATEIAPGKHAILLLDQAGWHLSARLVVPPNMTLVPLPAKCPELNPQENVWQFMRDNWLSNRVFKSYDDLVDHGPRPRSRAVFAFTYDDAMPDDDAGRDDFFILANHVAGLNGNPARNIVRYARQWCPWMGDDELAALVRRVLARPYRWSADGLGERLGLLDEVRTRLNITTRGHRRAKGAARATQARAVERQAAEANPRRL